jgi:Family of unknown function (DUF6152)
MTRVATATSVFVLVVATSIHAHHGYAGFFGPLERTVAVEGELENLVYGNPHVVIRLRAADATVYTVTWQSAFWVERNAGMTKATLKVGDHLVVIGAPSRDPDSHEVTMVKEVRRPRDQWIWRSTTPFVQPS